MAKKKVEISPEFLLNRIIDNIGAECETFGLKIEDTETSFRYVIADAMNYAETPGKAIAILDHASLNRLYAHCVVTDQRPPDDMEARLNAALEAMTNAFSAGE